MSSTFYERKHYTLHGLKRNRIIIYVSYNTKNLTLVSSMVTQSFAKTLKIFIEYEISKLQNPIQTNYQTISGTPHKHFSI